MAINGIPTSEGQLSRLANFSGAVNGNTHASEVKPTLAPRIVSDITTTIATESS